jgi:RNA polymerase sigma-70 factor, ECF subfamily
VHLSFTFPRQSVFGGGRDSANGPDAAGLVQAARMTELPSESDESAPSDRVSEFVTLYTRHYAQLQFYVIALLPSVGDAADVLQETSLVLWRKFSTYQGGTNFYAWACKIARLQALKHRQRMSRSARLFEIELMDQLAEEAAREEVATAASHEALAACMDKLSDGDRSLIRKRYQPNTSVRELAAEIGRTANSVSKSLGRIRRALLDCIQRQLASESNE